MNPSRPSFDRPAVRRKPGTLSVAWLNGAFSASFLLPSGEARQWCAAGLVKTPGQFGEAIDEALARLEFKGSQALLVLEHELLVHRVEPVPAVSARAARNYLRALVSREEGDRGPLLWCAQRAHSPRADACYVLHLLPADFFDEVNRAFAVRGLRLRRLFPLVVALLRELRGAVAPEKSALVAVEIGGETILVVGRGDGQPAFARRFSGSWQADAVRVAVEINRSIIYSRQRWGATPGTVRLFGNAGVVSEVRARCGEGKEVSIQPLRVPEWLLDAGALPVRDSGNLVLRRLRHRHRHEWLRFAVGIACWAGLAFFGLDCWSAAESARASRQELEGLRARTAAIEAQHARLIRRNQSVAQAREFLRQSADSRLPPVPGRFAAYATALMPESIHLTELQVQFASPGWSFRLTGTVASQAEAAHDILSNFQLDLQHGPWRARPLDGGGLAAIQSANRDPAGDFAFSIGGTLLEN
jgi:hypothetical protein